jgi:hypothetical protein
MSFPRTFELGGGLATGLLGIIVTLTILKDDLDTSRRLEREFRLFQELTILLIFFTAPTFLVVIGSYFHAVLGDSGRGRVMISVGSSVLTVFFLLFEINAGYAAMYRIGLRFWLVVLALLTLVASFMVRGKAHRNTDA